MAVDWVSGKLFWVDAVWARVEAMDLTTLIRVEILRTGPYTSPRAIAVEPLNRSVYNFHLVYKIASGHLRKVHVLD